MTDDVVAGYRSVRVLEENARARLVLAHARRRKRISAQDQHSVTPQSSAESWPEIRSLKQFPKTTTSTQILNEIHCLSLASGRHVPDIDDVAASADDEPILVGRWGGGVSLRKILRDRDSLRPGEAITIVAPLLTSLGRAHRSGVAIVAINLDAVQFDETGCPFFTDFSFAQLHTAPRTPHELQINCAFTDDRRLLAQLARSVLAAVRGHRDGQRAVCELDDWLADDAHFDEPNWDHHLERQLFSIGAPEPLRLNSDAPQSAAEEPTALRVSAVVDRAVHTESEASSVLALPPWLDLDLTQVLELVRRRSAAGIRAASAWCRPVRKRTWLFATAGLLCVLLAGVVLAVDATDEGEAAVQANRLSGPVEEEPTEITEETVDAPVSVALLGGEAADALPVLLKARSECLRDLSTVCLESVSLVGTPSYASDVALVNAVFAGGEFPTASLFAIEKSVEVQQLGDSVLFEFATADTSKPASILLVKGEAGWRIRSYTLAQ
ncbi:hypothetical protein [Rhodoglobus sp.]